MSHPMRRKTATDENRISCKKPTDQLSKIMDAALTAAKNHEYQAETVVKIHGIKADAAKERELQANLTPEQKKALERLKRDHFIHGTDDLVLKEFCEALIELQMAIISTDAEPSESTEAPLHGEKGPNHRAVKLKPLGEKIVALCERYDDRWGGLYANHVFHPKVTVMLRAMKRYGIPIAQRGPLHGKISHHMELADLLRRLVRFVRRVCKSWPFINSVNDHTKKECENFESARDLIYQLAARHTRLCVLRIDLTFRPEAKDFSHSEVADHALHLFLRSLRSKAMKRNLLKGYLGFIIKRENGLARGTHFHLMVLLNGSKHQNPEYLTEALGEMWLKRIGRDRGSFHNCCKGSKDLPFNGTGVIEGGDIEKWIGMRLALHYMSKQDCVLKVNNDKVKNFWRTPNLKGKGKKRGRKRKNESENDLEMMYRLLGGPRSKYPKGFDPQPYVLAHKRKQPKPQATWSWDTLPSSGELP